MKNKFQNYNRWYNTAEGKAVLANIEHYLAKRQEEIFGYYAVELGVLTPFHSLLASSRIPHCYRIAQEQGGDLIALPDFLPIMADNIDLLVASHVLECSVRPHQVLREIDRVLLPEGHCFLIGFSPFSFVGLENVFTRGKERSKKYQLRTVGRSKDWLKLLGFDILEVKHFGYRPAIKNKGKLPVMLWNSLSWLESLGERYLPLFGNVYVIHAKKQVIAQLPKKEFKGLTILSGSKPAVAVGNVANRVEKEMSNNV
jgi:SAM-dependent methyltransferase